MTKTTSNKPTHRVYDVTKRGEKSYWTPVGAAWAHKDGKGLSIKLDYVPRNPEAEIVIREALEDEGAQTDTASTQAAA